MPQFDTLFFLSQIFWLLVSFGGLYLGVYFIIFPMFQSIFSKRAALIELPLERAENLAKETQLIEQKLAEKKLAYDKRCNEHLNSVYQKNASLLKEALKKTDDSLNAALKKTIQKITTDETAVLKNANAFVKEALKGKK